MNFEERKNNLNSNILQNIILENREKATITGVLDVLSFDDQIIIIETELGLLTIKGTSLKINKLNIDTSETIIEGDVISLSYNDKNVTNKGEGIFSKIFK